MKKRNLVVRPFPAGTYLQDPIIPKFFSEIDDWVSLKQRGPILDKTWQLLIFDEMSHWIGKLSLCLAFFFMYMGRNSLDAYCVKNWSYLAFVWVTFVTSSEKLP